MIIIYNKYIVRCFLGTLVLYFAYHGRSSNARWRTMNEWQTYMQRCSEFYERLFETRGIWVTLGEARE